MKSFEKFSHTFIAFLQAIGIFFYCSLAGFLIWIGNELFGPVENFLGPLLFLSLLVASVLIVALLAFGYPVVLFWDQKKTKEAIEIVLYTAGWLTFFILLLLIVLVTF